MNPFELQDGRYPEGVTPELLADLYELAYCYGVENTYDHIKGLSDPSFGPVRVAVAADPKNKTMIVGGTSEKQEVFTTKGGMVFWMANADEVIYFIKQVDDFFAEKTNLMVSLMRKLKSMNFYFHSG